MRIDENIEHYRDTDGLYWISFMEIPSGKTDQSPIGHFQFRPFS